jgi:hypothetical protein
MEVKTLGVSRIAQMCRGITRVALLDVILYESSGEFLDIHDRMTR